MKPDLCVVGSGPTGRALASRALAAGMSVAVVDPRIDRAWDPTYSAFADELPAWLPAGVVSSRVEVPTVWTTRERRIERPYVVLSKPLLRDALALDGAMVFRERALSVTAHSVTLAGGTVVEAGLVVDARGLPAVGRRPAASCYGIFADADAAAAYVPPGEMLLLDWRPDNGATNAEPPSFMYAVPIGDGTVVFEETTLGVPGGLSRGELRKRAHTRLAAHGVRLTGNEEWEHCHYPLDAPPPKRRHGDTPFAWGGRGGLMHPCTGYSVGHALAQADTVVQALVAGQDPVRALWTEKARATYWMRERGMKGLGRITTEQCASMFDSFFRASLRGQRALLSTHDDPAALGLVLFNTVARTWPFRWRFALVGWTHRNRWADWNAPAVSNYDLATPRPRASM